MVEKLAAQDPQDPSSCQEQRPQQQQHQQMVQDPVKTPHLAKKNRFMRDWQLAVVRRKSQRSRQSPNFPKWSLSSKRWEKADASEKRTKYKQKQTYYHKSCSGLHRGAETKRSCRVLWSSKATTQVLTPFYSTSNLSELSISYLSLKYSKSNRRYIRHYF